MKLLSNGQLLAFLLVMALVFIAIPCFSQTSQNNKTETEGDTTKFGIFNDEIPSGAYWQGEEEFVHAGGSDTISANYIYVQSSNSPAKMSGLSIPIRENPGPGEFRFITFKWIKWGDDLQIGMHFDHQLIGDSNNRIGEEYNYTYKAGEGKAIPGALLINDNGPGNWTSITRDLWKDFGDFTLKGVSFICPDSRDAGFDALFLAQNLEALEGGPGILPNKIAESVDVQEENSGISSSDIAGDSPEEQAEENGVKIDWAAQIKAGGAWMYPLYILGLVAIVISVQRFMTSREEHLAPKKLRSLVRNNLSQDDVGGALKACEEHPSPLGEALGFIFKHKEAGREVVSETAGDIAARDIKDHLNRIYPLSVIASLSPLLGLLGTIVGMIEAFGLVAMYGDEGGAAVLSDAISKALITTATGLIIAAPSIAVYFIIRKRIMGLASIIEVEIENAITMLYLNEDAVKIEKSKNKNHASTI